MLTSLGREDKLILRIKLSFPSNLSSSFIVTLNVTSIFPTGNVTVYGPE